jgi:hypothetical protein
VLRVMNCRDEGLDAANPPFLWGEVGTQNRRGLQEVSVNMFTDAATGLAPYITQGASMKLMGVRFFTPSLS